MSPKPESPKPVKPRHAWSIRRRVLAWLFLAMALVFSANLLSSYYSNIDAADRAFDRLLLASASAIAERTAVRGDELVVDIPYVALDMLASTAQDRVFYSVSAPNGKIITGYEGIPLPNKASEKVSITPVYYNAHYKRAAVRVVTLRSFISSSSLSGYATIQVAQTRGERDNLSSSLLQQSALWMLAIAIVGAIAAWFGVSIGLRPLVRLRDALGRRSPDDVRPVLHDVPNEFRPLVGAINGMLGRLDGGMSSMRNFISDASHQLKTPLASLLAQSEMALRETNTEDLHDALIKVNDSAKRTSRLAQQLLSHASATDVGHDFGRVNLVQLVQDTIEISLPAAAAKSIDLGYDGPAGAVLFGNRTLIGELILNLSDNAIKYSPTGSVVTIGIQASDTAIKLYVDDNGPGIPIGDRHKVFERFVRLQTTSAEGCGLGLAIVREIAERHGATVQLEDSPSGPSGPSAPSSPSSPSGQTGGLRVCVVFPLEEGLLR